MHNRKLSSKLTETNIYQLLLTCNLRQSFLGALLQLVDPLLHVPFQVPVWVLWSDVPKRVLQINMVSFAP